MAVFSRWRGRKGKNHAVIKHKGKHVMNVRLLTWEAIPSDYQEILIQDYDDALKEALRSQIGIK